jgi:5-methyltetrahydropteroyltriglutamate--homocysteine methyltransferase
VINPEFMLKVFNNTVKGLRAKTEVWCHTCWGNPSQQRMFGSVQSYKPALELLNQVDADVITFEMKSSNLMDLTEIGAAITHMKVCVGAIDHHTLQVEAPTEVADLIRQALKVIPAERLVLSSDCGMRFTRWWRWCRAPTSSGKNWDCRWPRVSAPIRSSH